MITPNLASSSISISDHKKNPMGVIELGGGLPVAVLNHNKPAFYCVPPDTYEAMMDKLDDLELRYLIEEREARKDRKLIEVNLDDL
jgi:antitoxin StbD